jgi:hypothetical protein
LDASFKESQGSTSGCSAIEVKEKWKERQEEIQEKSK